MVEQGPRTRCDDAGAPRPARSSGTRRRGVRRAVAGTTPDRRRAVASTGAGGREGSSLSGCPAGGATANLECTLVDGSGAILLVFQGRRRIPGIQQGARLVAQGMVGAWEGQLAILNPEYELIAGPDTKEVDVGV